MNIRPVGADLLHADGRTGMTKLIVACRNFANRPKKGSTENQEWHITHGPYSNKCISS